MTKYYAHSKNKVQRKHLLKDHLTSVAELVRCFSEGLAWQEEAELAGQLHDLGKYGDLFQARLRHEVTGIDHWSPGAWAALTGYHSVAGALAIQGHHIGLQQGSKDALRRMNLVDLDLHHPLNLKLSDKDSAKFSQRFTADHITSINPNKKVIDISSGIEKPLATMLDVRMLFSCLVDADFLDTEAHFDGDEQGKVYREYGTVLNADEALHTLEHFMDKNIRNGITTDQNVLDARNAL